jgi:restriction system protein
MLTSHLKSFALAEWQIKFVDQYLRDTKTKSLLIAAPGTGKTVTALYAAKKMLESRTIDSTLIITDRVVLRDQFRSTAQIYGMDLTDSIEGCLRGDGAAVTIQSLRSERQYLSLEEVGKSRRWFIIADEPVFAPEAVVGVVDQLLAGNKDSKVLFVARQIPKEISFESEFRFHSEFILDRSIIQLPSTEIQVARFAPSFSLLRQLERGSTALDDLSWREFEKLIAALLEKDGYVVDLMQGSKDGGVDVVAVKNMGAAGYFKTLWQAKKKAQKNKVGISIVRELADTRQEFGASKGIIVTSSYLTSGALQRVDRDKYLLGKIDRDDLEQWIQRTLFGRVDS